MSDKKIPAKDTPAVEVREGESMTHKMIMLDKIVIDPRVQRLEGVNERAVVKMVNSFDRMALGSITVSARKDGTYVCLDGMHRCESSNRVGFPGPLAATVLSGLTLEREAELFLRYNTMTQPTPVSKFMVRATSGDEKAIAILKILESHGWQVGIRKIGSLSSIVRVESVYTTGVGVLPEGEYPELLNTVFGVLTAAWSLDATSSAESIVGGLGQLFARFGEEVDIARLVHVLIKENPSELAHRAHAASKLFGGNAPPAMARVMVELYNKGRRTKQLPQWVWTK